LRFRRIPPYQRDFTGNTIYLGFPEPLVRCFRRRGRFVDAAPVTLEAGSTGTLTLGAPTQFTGTVSGLAPGNYLDLPDIAFGASSTLGYTSNNSDTGGVLAVSDGTHVASIALLGQYAASSFVMASDGHGSTLITDPPALVAQTQLTLPHS
jgi:hypothetical protein